MPKLAMACRLRGWCMSAQQFAIKGGLVLFGPSCLTASTTCCSLTFAAEISTSKAMPLQSVKPTESLCAIPFGPFETWELNSWKRCKSRDTTCFERSVLFIGVQKMLSNSELLTATLTPPISDLFSHCFPSGLTGEGFPLFTVPAEEKPRHWD